MDKKIIDINLYSFFSNSMDIRTCIAFFFFPYLYMLPASKKFKYPYLASYEIYIYICLDPDIDPDISRDIYIPKSELVFLNLYRTVKHC